MRWQLVLFESYSGIGDFSWQLFILKPPGPSWSLFTSEEIEKERREWEEKLAAADKKVSESQKALEDMKADWWFGTFFIFP